MADLDILARVSAERTRPTFESIILPTLARQCEGDRFLAIDDNLARVSKERIRPSCVRLPLFDIDIFSLVAGDRILPVDEPAVGRMLYPVRLEDCKTSIQYCSRSRSSSRKNTSSRIENLKTARSYFFHAFCNFWFGCFPKFNFEMCDAQRLLKLIALPTYTFPVTKFSMV